MNIIEKALKENRTRLSEYEAKQVLASYQIPVTKEILVDDVQDFIKATQEIGYPLVLKACSSEIPHKTEKGLIRVDIRNYEEARTALEDIMTNMSGNQNAILVQQMVKGRRELVVGMTRDPDFGPCVVFGLGGIFTEILKDTAFRIAPLGKQNALEMMREIRGHKILDAVRGMQAVDLDVLAHILSNVGRIGLENERVTEIDINPVIIFGSKPVAVDALMVLE